MTENLKTTKYRDSSAIFTTTCPANWANLTKGAFCWYKNNSGNKTTYGALYNWHAVKTGKLCPVGWNTPCTETTNSSGFSAFPGGLHKSNGSF